MFTSTPARTLEASHLPWRSDLASKRTTSPTPGCGGRLRVIAAVQDPLAVQAILAHLARSISPEAPGPGPPAPAVRRCPRLAVPLSTLPLTLAGASASAAALLCPLLDYDPAAMEDDSGPEDHREGHARLRARRPEHCQVSRWGWPGETRSWTRGSPGRRGVCVSFALETDESETPPKPRLATRPDVRQP